MPCVAIVAPSTCRRARMPPWIIGWSVLTRPSMISGKPVTDETSTAATSASTKVRWVPPVDRISTPRSANARAKGTMPDLSDTLTKARLTWVVIYKADSM